MTTKQDVIKIVEEQVNPSLALHGGAMEVMDLTDGILFFKFTGMCANCPSSKLSTYQAIVEILLKSFPELEFQSL